MRKYYDKNTLNRVQRSVAAHTLLSFVEMNKVEVKRNHIQRGQMASPAHEVRSIKTAMKLYSKHDSADTTWILCYAMNTSRMTLSCRVDMILDQNVCQSLLHFNVSWTIFKAANVIEIYLCFSNTNTQKKIEMHKDFIKQCFCRNVWEFAIFHSLDEWRLIIESFAGSILIILLLDSYIVFSTHKSSRFDCNIK